MAPLLLFWIPKLCGALGLIVITKAIFIRKEKSIDKHYIVGGSLLLIYSIALVDPIFIVLQTVFILASAYELYKISQK